VSKYIFMNKNENETLFLGHCGGIQRRRTGNRKGERERMQRHKRKWNGDEGTGMREFR
jgi:hypothetical protein